MKLDVDRLSRELGRDRGVGTYVAAPAARDIPRIPMTSGALILHDDGPTLGLVRSVLESSGFEVAAASSSYRAVTADLGAPAHLVLLGMTAVEDRDLEIVPILRRRWPSAYLLVLFPTALRERAARALHLGADASLPEPFYPGELTSIVQQLRARLAAAPAATPPTQSPPTQPPSTQPPAATPAAPAPPAAGGSVQQLAAGVAHSVRNPLQILELQLSSVEAEGSIDVPGMREQVRRIASVVDGLTRFSGHRHLALRPVEFDAFVLDVYAGRGADSAGPEIVTKPGADGAEVLAAPELLRAALESLRARAARVTPAAGRIEVRTSLLDDAGRTCVEIAVTDGGPALTEGHRARLFEPYPDPDTIQDGTGLELAALAGVVRDHGGTVSALDAAPAGTTIVVRLPARLPGTSARGRSA